MSVEAENVVGVYRRHAIAWTTARGDQLRDGGWLERFCERLPPNATVLDLGCGSGVPISRELATRGYLTTGVDSSPEMIALFNTNLPDQRSCLSDMRTLRLETTFAGVIAWDSFFHLRPDDQRRMFNIFAEHTRKSSLLMFTSGPRFGEVIGNLEGDPLYHASLDAAEYVHLLNQIGFVVVSHSPEDPNCGGRTVWLAQRG